MTSVRVTVALTRNLGNYESIKIGADVEDTVIVKDGESTGQATKRTLDTLYNFVSGQVDAKSTEAVEQLTNRV